MKNNKLIAAFATNDGRTLIKDHFGEAKKFLRYEVSECCINFLDAVENNSEEERMHSDPKKAKSIASILKKESVQVLISNAFGGNIVRMKKKFVCIKCDNYDLIEDFFPVIIKNFNIILKEWEKGEERDFLVL